MDGVGGHGPVVEVSKRRGPWAMGGEFWRVSEDIVATYIDRHSRQGGCREIAAPISQEQNTSLIVSELDAEEFCSVCTPTPTHG